MQGLVLSDRHRSNTTDAGKKKLFVRALLCAVRPEPPQALPTATCLPRQEFVPHLHINVFFNRFRVEFLGSALGGFSGFSGLVSTIHCFLYGFPTKNRPKQKNQFLQLLVWHKNHFLQLLVWHKNHFLQLLVWHKFKNPASKLWIFGVFNK